LDREGDFGSYFGEFGYRNGEVVLSGAVMKIWGEDIRCLIFVRDFVAIEIGFSDEKAVSWLFVFGARGLPGAVVSKFHRDLFDNRPFWNWR
jgi:hypothetical protein